MTEFDAGIGSVRKYGLAESLEGLLRPLEFAVRDGGQNCERMPDLEKTAIRACRNLGELALPPDLLRLFSDLVELFSEEGRVSEEGRGEARVARVEEALRRLSPLRERGWVERCLSRPTSVLPGIGGKRAESLARRVLSCIGDLLSHLPSRYEDRRHLSCISEVEVGRRSTLIADVLLVDFVSTHSRGRSQQILQVVVGDAESTLNLKWFRGGESIARNLKKGDRLLVTGDVKRYRFSKEMVHPEIERLDGAEEGAETKDTAQIVPLYSAPEGVNPRTLRRLIQRVVDEYADLLQGYLPADLILKYELPGMGESMRLVHRPDPTGDVDAYSEFRSTAHQRLVLEELYLLEIGLVLRLQARGFQPGMALDGGREAVESIIGALPFELTRGQAQAWSEVKADLARPHPMNRLLQGDVGSGKTVLALLAAVASQASGYQSALMAPTELLAEQHARSFSGLLATLEGSSPLRVGLLTASLSGRQKAEVKRALAAGELDLLVGTHALVQEDLKFARLGLLIIDEQHRFGVRQRGILASRGAKGLLPDRLLMSATPIPRTLAQTVYGDLDVSVIDELPPGRKPVETHLLRDGEGGRIVELMRQTLGRNEQVYVVYPLVEESESVDLRSALESAERIRRAFPEASVGMVHGRLQADERNEIMNRFIRAEVQVLVATTVIEVGVDVPNATLMVVEHAERFGLAQLHQLRGRVGRGTAASSCLLVDRGGGEKAEARLRAMLDTTDGFRIAEADLRIRGPGEFLGTQQSGQLLDLKVANLLRDARLVSVAREAALEKVREDPGLQNSSDLARAVEARWGDRLSLADVG